MPGEVLALFANHFSQPLFDLGVIDIVVVYPFLITGIIRRVNLDALYLALILWQQSFQRLQIVSVDNHVFAAVVLGVLSDFVIAVLALQHPVRHLLVVVYHFIFSNIQVLAYWLPIRFTKDLAVPR